MGCCNSKVKPKKTYIKQDNLTVSLWISKENGIYQCNFDNLVGTIMEQINNFDSIQIKLEFGNNNNIYISLYESEIKNNININIIKSKLNKIYNEWMNLSYPFKVQFGELLQYCNTINDIENKLMLVRITDIGNFSVLPTQHIVLYSDFVKIDTDNIINNLLNNKLSYEQLELDNISDSIWNKLNQHMEIKILLS